MIPVRSSFAEPEPVLLRRVGPYKDRITVFRRLFDDGVTARAAKDTVDALASRDYAICPVLSDADMSALARDLRVLDVEMSRRRCIKDGAAFIADVRARHKLSQSEFADRLGLDVRTLQNWEQGRNKPDNAALALVLLFDRDPALVEQAVFERVAETA